MKYHSKYKFLSEQFIHIFKEKPTNFFAIPGRVEFIGNHTDHQGGKTLSFTIDRYIYACANKRDDNLIVLHSKNYSIPTLIDLNDIEFKNSEKGTSIALIKGVATYFKNHNFKIGGFNLYTYSNIPRGMGLSSSAAFETLIAKVLNELYNNLTISPLNLAKAGQFAEIHYFGKPCGLLDQLTVSYEQLVYCDFKNKAPEVEQISAHLLDDFDIHLIYIGKGHAGLSHHYKRIVDDMNLVNNYYKKEQLRDVNEEQFFNDFVNLNNVIPLLALNRAKHFFLETRRVEEVVDALHKNDKKEVIKLINESGESSATLLKNLSLPNEKKKTLENSYYLLKEKFPTAAVRIHGGGFGGTLLFVSLKEEKLGKELREFCKSLNLKRIYKIKPSLS